MALSLEPSLLRAATPNPNGPLPRMREVPVGQLAYVAETDEYLKEQYIDWFNHYVVDAPKTLAYGYGYQRLRVQRDSASDYDTVSEGQAYGMLLAVNFGDRDALYKMMRYANDHRHPFKGGMQWMVRADDQDINEFRLPLDRGAFHFPYAYLKIEDFLLPDAARHFVTDQDPAYKADPTGYLRASENPRDFSSATDADVDIAAALVLAVKRWGDHPYYNFRPHALQWIKDFVDWDTKNLLLANGKRGQYMRAGSDWGDQACWNPSYFTPAWIRMFVRFLEEDRAKNSRYINVDAYIAKLNSCLETMYSEMALIDASNGPKGLFPDWLSTAQGRVEKTLASDRSYLLDNDGKDGLDMFDSNNDGVLDSYIIYDSFTTTPNGKPQLAEAPLQSFNFYYDAIRVAWRIGQDYRLNNDPRAKAISQEIGAFFHMKQGSFKDGYSYTGGAWKWNDRDAFNNAEGGKWPSLPFLAMAAVSSMHQPDEFINRVNRASYYNKLKNGKEPYVNTHHYYGNTLRLLSLLYMTGRMPDSIPRN